jgi:hypothetical protein
VSVFNVLSAPTSPEAVKTSDKILIHAAKSKRNFYKFFGGIPAVFVW